MSIQLRFQNSRHQAMVFGRSDVARAASLSSSPRQASTESSCATRSNTRRSSLVTGLAVFSFHALNGVFMYVPSPVPSATSPGPTIRPPMVRFLSGSGILSAIASTRLPFDLAGQVALRRIEPVNTTPSRRPPAGP